MKTKREPTADTRGLATKQNKKLTRESLNDNSAGSNFEQQFPILRGYREGGLGFVHSPWCDRMHIHGWDPEHDANVVGCTYAHECHDPAAPKSNRTSVFREKDIERLAQESWRRGR